jgi:hypothetical protein
MINSRARLAYFRKFLISFIAALMVLSFQNCQKPFSAIQSGASLSIGNISNQATQQPVVTPPLGKDTLPNIPEPLAPGSDLVSTTIPPSGGLINDAFKTYINIMNVENSWRPLVGSVVGRRLAFVADSSAVRSYDERALNNAAVVAPLSSIPASSLTSAWAPIFDFDGDGSPDLGTIESAATSISCDDGNKIMSRAYSVLSGRNLSQLKYKSGQINDLCVPINNAETAQSTSLHLGAFQYGTQAGAIALAPQYLETGWFLLSGAGSFFYPPTTPGYGNYINAKPMLQPSSGGLSYQRYSAPLTGFVVQVNGASRYVATSSGRFMSYTMGANSTQQLLGDSTFLARPDIVGRNYGLLQHDISGNPNKIFLITGTPAKDLFDDVKKGYASSVVTGSDLWAGIERHVSVLDMSQMAVTQKFYSYAHDGGEANTYRNRITYPSLARLPSKSSAGSRMAYNVFDGSTWSIHISIPGGVASQSILANYYVWDLVQVDNDTVDIITSPIDLSRKVWIPNFTTAKGLVGSWRQENYFPEIKTKIFRWTRQSEMMSLKSTITGGIPYVEIPFPNRGTEASGTGYLFPSLRAMDQATQSSLSLLLYSPSAAPSLGVGGVLLNSPIGF